VFTGTSSLLRRLTAASSLILLGLAVLVPPAAGATPAPDPSPSSVNPDPYGPASTPPPHVHVVLPPAPAPVYRAPAPSRPPAHKAPVKHATHRAAATPTTFRFPQPEFPAASIANEVVDVATAGSRISTGLALAVAALVLLSGALIAGVAREVAR
jgi:hypothetical protein